MFFLNFIISDTPKLNSTSNVTEEQKNTAKLLGENLDLSKAKMPSSDFQQPLVRYLIKNANGHILFKLMNCHKWFIPSNFKLVPNNFRRNRRTEHYFTKPAYSWDTENLEISKQNHIFSFLEKSLFCDVRGVRLLNVVIKWNDLKYLVSSRNVKHILLYEVTVLNEKEEIASINDILDFTPKLRGFYLIGKSFNCVNGEIIAKKLLKTDIDCIRFLEIPESFDFQSFVNIIKEKPGFPIQLNFHKLISDEHVERIKAGCPSEYTETCRRLMTDEERARNLPRFFDVNNHY